MDAKSECPFPLATFRSRPAESFSSPRPNEALSEEFRELLGSPGACIPWAVHHRVATCQGLQNNSLPRQFTNPLDYALGVLPKQVLLLQMALGKSNSFVHIPITEKIHKVLLRKNGSLALSFNAEVSSWDFRINIWSLKIISVACSHQPSQVFSVCLWFTPYDSINSARDACAELSLKANPNSTAGSALEITVCTANSISYRWDYSAPYSAT